MPQIDKLFDKMLAKGASDLHLSEGSVPKIREHGSLVGLGDEPVLTRQSIINYLQEICPPKKWNAFHESMDIDFAYAKDKLSRFRANYFMQIHGIGSVFRIIPNRIQSLKELNLPESLKSFAQLPSGLVLVTGPTGSGKSTTLAAIINHINENFHRYILTIEEPIEFVHISKKSTFCHREVGIHVHSFGQGLRTACRQDLDVILVGEMRDYETISLALSAASMGALVFGTLHTNSAIKSINRIIDVFPADMQAQARDMVAYSLKGVCAQLLMKKTNGGRVAVNEILMDAPGLGNTIREKKIAQIANIMLAGKERGMISMDDAIWKELEQGNVSAIEAYHKAEFKERFESLYRQEAKIQK